MIYIVFLMFFVMVIILRRLKKDGLSINKKDIYMIFSNILFINISGFIIFGENRTFFQALSKVGLIMFGVVNLVLAISYPLLVIRLKEKKINIRCILQKTFALMSSVYAFFVLEISYNQGFLLMRWQYRLINVTISFLAFLIIYNITIRKKIALTIFFTFHLLLGLINGFVIMFKDSAFMPSDILAWRTALGVASQYEFRFSWNMITAMVLYIILIGITIYILPAKVSQWNIVGKIVSIGSLVFTVSLFNNFDLAHNFRVAFNNWQPQESYYNYGFQLAFSSYAQGIRTVAPEGYSKNKVAQILNEITIEQQEAESEYPTIIAIMNESYSDLKVFGDFECEPEYMPFWKQEDHFAMSGNLFVSTYAGGTSNTEFEFLTGNSVRNIGLGIYPYQAYGFKTIPNLARTLKGYGYDTIAIHPEKAYNWSRNKVYKEMGFDKFLSIEDFEDAVLVRDHVSDKSSYDKIIEEYETAEGPSFIFNITMQNHGGYLYDVFPETELVQLSDDLQSYMDLREYLTLINESDKAIKNLLEYFEGVDEPVIVCFFGDHQPGLAYIFESEEAQTPELLEKRYITPFFIWKNYDSEMETTADTSTNYLGALLLEQAGLVNDKQNQFLLDMWRNIPVYNTIAYKNSSNIWNEFSEGDLEWIEKYKNLQYYWMFDQ